MGIRSGATQDDVSLPMFSDDILKIEISGPEVRKFGVHCRSDRNAN